MQRDAHVDRRGRLQNQEQSVQWIDDRRLHSGDERHAAEHIRVPERQLAARERMKAELALVEVLVPRIGVSAAQHPAIAREKRWQEIAERHEQKKAEGEEIGAPKPA